MSTILLAGILFVVAGLIVIGLVTVGIIVLVKSLNKKGDK